MARNTRSRRGFLRTTAAAALSVGVAGCGTGGDGTTASPAGESSPADAGDGASVSAVEDAFGDRFGSIVDVASAGADVAGEARIDDVVDDAIEDDTVLYFPEGQYRLGALRVADRTNLGFASLPGEDVTIVPADPASDMDHQFLEFSNVEDLLVEGLTFDYRDPERGGVLRFLARGDVVARDLRIVGKVPDWSQPDHPVAFRFDILDESATGVAKNLVATDGGHDGGNGIGVYVGKDHAGELVLEDCQIENFPNNGLYASSPGRELDGFTGKDGAVHVRGGRWANNNIANVRLGTTDATVRDATVVVDEVPPVPEDSSLNARGIRLRGKEGQVVENCEIVIGADAGKGFGAIVVHGANGRATIRDTEITVDRDGVYAINGMAPTDFQGPAGLELENVTITGSAAGSQAVSVVGRDGTTLRNVTVEQSGADRTGLAFADARDCLVADSTVRVTGTPIVTDDADVERENTTIEPWNETTQRDA